MDQELRQKTLVSVIIPAYNEEKTVANVIGIVRAHPLVAEIIVVDDGSRDKTAQKAEAAGARVIRLARNRGKGEALNAGVEAAACDTVLFLDADLRGLTSDMVTNLAKPVLSGAFDMYVALHDRKYYWINEAHKYVPVLAGQRALKKRVWRHIPAVHRKKFQIEIALNYFSKKNGERTGFILLPGLSHIIKEKKHGYRRGFAERVRMISDLIRATSRLYVVDALKSRGAQWGLTETQELEK